MTAQPDLQAMTERFHATIHGQLEVNRNIEQLLKDAEQLARSGGADNAGVMGTLRALKKADTSGLALLSVLEVAKRNAREARPAFGPPTICPDRATAANAA